MMNSCSLIITMYCGSASADWSECLVCISDHRFHDIWRQFTLNSLYFHVCFPLGRTGSYVTHFTHSNTEFRPLVPSKRHCQPWLWLNTCRLPEVLWRAESKRYSLWKRNIWQFNPQSLVTGAKNSQDCMWCFRYESKKCWINLCKVAASRLSADCWLQLCARAERSRKLGCRVWLSTHGDHVMWFQTENSCLSPRRMTGQNLN